MKFEQRRVDGIPHIAIHVPNNVVAELGGVATLEEMLDQIGIDAIAASNERDGSFVAVPLGNKDRRHIETILGATIVRLTRNR